MNKTVLTQAIIQHVNHCYHQVAEIDRYTEQNVLNEAQLKNARLRREKAMVTYQSARYLLVCLREWEEMQEKQYFSKVKELLNLTGGDLRKKFEQQRIKQ